MTTEKTKVEVLETSNLNVAINGINKDTNSQYNRENVYFISIGSKLGSDFRHPAIIEGIKIDARSIHFNTIKNIAERNANLDLFDMATVNLAINKVKTKNGTTGWTVANVMQGQTKVDFIIACVAKGMSKEEAIELWELSL